MDNNIKQNIYLVYEENKKIPDVDAIKQNKLRVFNTHEAADEFAKFQRNTYVCDPNFADFTYMPDESKEGENYAFAYNLTPDGMSREGGFNIIIAEVPMEKDEDAHNNCVTSLKELGKVAIFNADEVLSFTLDKGEEYQLDEAKGELSVFIPPTFDVDKAFGLNLNTFTNDDTMILYANWYYEKKKLELLIIYQNDSTDDGDFELYVQMSPEQKKNILMRLEEQFKEVYKKSIGDAVEEMLKYDNNDKSGEDDG